MMTTHVRQPAHVQRQPQRAQGVPPKSMNTRNKNTYQIFKSATRPTTRGPIKDEDCYKPRSMDGSCGRTKFKPRRMSLLRNTGQMIDRTKTHVKLAMSIVAQPNNNVFSPSFIVPAGGTRLEEMGLSCLEVESCCRARVLQ
jgi:hypothetical protein